MKKNMRLTVFLFLVSRCSITADTTEENVVYEETKEYRSQVEAFKSIDLKTLERKIDTNDSLYVYIGRESCPYCRIFVPKLEQASTNTQTLIYYLDTENTSEDSLEIEFMKKMKLKLFQLFFILMTKYRNT